MTRRNDKRSNRRNRQRNNNTELPPFAQMLFGAIVGKGIDMIAKKMAENNEETPDIHAEGISNQDVTNINKGKATLSKLRIPADGSAVEYPIPDNLQFFFDEEGKLMVRKKIEGGEKHTNGAEEVKPITYDDIIKELYIDKKAYWACGKDNICGQKQSPANYEDAINSTTPAQAKRYAAFNKLQNIAKYLNKGWKPNFKDHSKNWYIYKDILYGVTFNYTTNQGTVYFKNADLAEEAIQLMGKDSLNDLFSTDW